MIPQGLFSTLECRCVRVSIYEVGPRDGLQALEEFVPTEVKQRLIASLYEAGLEHVEETSMVHPRFVPQMADAEEVFSKGAVLVLNERGYKRAKSVGASKINIVFSPCETFNLKNMNKTRSELVLMYRNFLDKTPKEDVRVYLSMAFGSPYSGGFTEQQIRLCLRDAKMFGSTVVFSDTVGVGLEKEVALFAKLAREEGLTPALHLHHKGKEERAMSLVRAGLLAGITQFDSSIGGLGGCPFVEESGANLSTETLAESLNAWGFETGIDLEKLRKSSKIAEKIKMKKGAAWLVN